jgi:hypothetical protein
VCEDCGHTTENPEEHLTHLQKFHPNSPALKRSYDRRIIKIPKSGNMSNINDNNQHDANSSYLSLSSSSNSQPPYSPESTIIDALKNEPKIERNDDNICLFSPNETRNDHEDD